MHYGFTFFPTTDSIHPADVARAAEERDFESAWFAEHSHIPVGPATPGPPGPGEPGLPAEYYTVMDPFVALAMAAQATTRLKLATGICLVPQRDIFQTATQVATLDQLSNGRFLFGVGAGWNQPEIENHGIAFEERFAVMREKLAAMKQLWTEERAQYDGEHVRFEPAFAWPEPSQRPHPPIHMGGAGITAIRRAVRDCDGWVPLWGGGHDPLELMAQLAEELAASDRNASDFELSIYFCPPDADVVARCRDAGVTRVLFPLPSVAEPDALRTLDQYAKLMD
jgi:probable F420-dependent oxidoreductase